MAAAVLGHKRPVLEAVLDRNSVLGLAQGDGKLATQPFGIAPELLELSSSEKSSHGN